MNKVLLVTVLAIIFIPALVLLAGRTLAAGKEKEEIRILKSSAADLSGQNYDELQLSGLPEPVRRYFKYALKDGQQYVSSVSLKHDGQFKTALDREWIDIEGQQYFTAGTPGFLWKGKTALFSVRDMYIGGKGRIGRVSDYRQVSSMMIPMRIEALWKIDGVEHSYARFKISEIEHY